MPSAYLLENGTDRYLLEDSSGVYLKDFSSVVAAYKFRVIVRGASSTIAKMAIHTGNGPESNYIRIGFNEEIERTYAGNLTDAQIRINFNAELMTWSDINGYTQASWQT